MKKILFIFSVLTLMLSYGCNRDEGTETDTGMQREERLDTTNQDLETPGAVEETDTMDIQREEADPIGGEYREGDLNAPVDETMELEEEK